MSQGTLLLQELLYCLLWIVWQHRIDQRFIPTEMTFSTPSSSCLTNPDPDKYQSKTLFTTALQQGKVELTLDEENQERTKAKAIKDAYKMGDGEESENLGDFTASVGDNEENEEEGGMDQDAISKYRALLAGVGDVIEKPSEGDMEVTWNDEGGNENEEELTPCEKYLKKKKELKIPAEDSFAVDVTFDRFSALFSRLDIRLLVFEGQLYTIDSYMDRSPFKHYIGPRDVINLSHEYNALRQ